MEMFCSEREKPFPIFFLTKLMLRNSVYIDLCISNLPDKANSSVGAESGGSFVNVEVE
jgi:hypothetical protein